MSSDLLSQNAGWQDVESTLVKFRACGDGFAEFVVDQLEELERLRLLLEERERTNDAERRELESARQELKAEQAGLAEQRRCLERDAEQIEEHSQRLEKSQAELEESRAEFAKLREASAGETGTATTALLSQLETVERERDELAQQLAASRAQIGRLADVTAELAEVRAELLRQPERLAAETQTAIAALEQQLAQLEQQRSAMVLELAEARQQISRLAELEQQRSALEQELSSSRSQIDRLVDATAELATVRGELASARAALLERADRSPEAAESEQVWRDQIRDMQHERDMLEAELETVRRRVVELAEVAASEKQRSTQERSEWSKEFKQLRKLLEVQTKSPAPKAAAPAETATAAVAAPAAQAVPAGAGDPILESVMAQFDMLQKDIARRRSSPKSTKK